MSRAQPTRDSRLSCLLAGWLLLGQPWDAAQAETTAPQSGTGNPPSPMSTATKAHPDRGAAAPLWWRRHREGWFWYEDPPGEAEPRKSEPVRDPQAEREAEDLAAFEAIQRRLDRLRRVAVMNPSSANLQAYMRAQREVMDRAERFATGWQRLLWEQPDLDYSLNGRPTNTLAIAAFDERQRSRDSDAVRRLAATHGLIFVFRGDCPFCHRFAPILKRFAQQHGLTVLPVSLDGGTLPEYPDARPDNGIAARLNARAVPALYLTQPRQREVRPVGFGLMSDSDLLERLAAIAREGDPPASPTASRITP
jgi:conjugal transfer pilus assembly protein TraF